MCSSYCNMHDNMTIYRSVVLIREEEKEYCDCIKFIDLVLDLDLALDQFPRLIFTSDTQTDYIYYLHCMYFYPLILISWSNAILLNSYCKIDVKFSLFSFQ